MTGLIHALIWPVCFIAVNSLAFAAELIPGTEFRLAFPDLGPTLAEQIAGEPRPCEAVVRLPDDYAAHGTHPLFVFLTHGDGFDVSFALHRASEVTRRRRYVVATFPLFRRAIDPNERYGGIQVGVDDYAVIGPAYTKISESLFEAVPNLRASGNALGGFSNGAHTVAALVTHQDEATFARFDKFVLIEGGRTLSGFTRRSMRDRSFLCLRGGAIGGADGYIASRRFDAMEAAARLYGVDLETVVMRGAGHQFEPRSYPIVRRWLARHDD